MDEQKRASRKTIIFWLVVDFRLDDVDDDNVVKNVSNEQTVVRIETEED